MANRRSANFPPALIKVLERRVNGKCSNPNCRIPTSGPTVDEKKSNNMGVAAHIKAASCEGPRYDKEMSLENRKSIGNAIWLCSNCSTIIDKDPNYYSVEFLQQWKKKAEDMAFEEYGKAPVSRSDYETLHGLVFGKLNRNLLSSAVSNICRLNAAALEELDPRFSVEVDHRAGNTSYIFSAKQPVQIDYNIKKDFKDEFVEKFKDLIFHGRTLEIDSSAMKFSGSPLFQFDAGVGGQVILESTARKKAIAKISLDIEATTNKIIYLDDIVGEVVTGTKSITFSGSSLGGMYFFQIRYVYDPAGGGKLSNKIDFGMWEGKSVSALPYFDKIFAMHTALFEEQSMSIIIEIEGKSLLSGSGIKLGNREKCLEIYRLLRHLRNVRYILKILKLDVKFDKKIEVSNEECNAVEQVYQYLHNYTDMKKNEVEKYKVEISISKDASYEQVQEIADGNFGAIKIERVCNMTLKLLSLQLRNVRLNIIFSNAILKSASTSQVLAAGETVELEIVPSDDCVIYTNITHY